jgi:hypothetical protein
MPDEARNREGKIVLGSIDDSSQNEHLDMGEYLHSILSTFASCFFVMVLIGSRHTHTGHPLASSIPLRDGSTKIRVPDTGPGDNYVVVRASHLSSHLFLQPAI